jgi:hypothetical protein
MQELISDIADAVKRECACDCAVSPHLNQVVAQIGNSGFDQHMDNLILQNKRSLTGITRKRRKPVPGYPGAE